MHRRSHTHTDLLTDGILETIYRWNYVNLSKSGGRLFHNHNTVSCAGLLRNEKEKVTHENYCIKMLDEASNWTQTEFGRHLRSDSERVGENSLTPGVSRNPRGGSVGCLNPRPWADAWQTWSPFPVPNTAAAVTALFNSKWSIQKSDSEIPPTRSGRFRDTWWIVYHKNIDGTIAAVYSRPRQK